MNDEELKKQTKECLVRMKSLYHECKNWCSSMDDETPCAWRRTVYGHEKYSSEKDKECVKDCFISEVRSLAVLAERILNNDDREFEKCVLKKLDKESAVNTVGTEGKSEIRDIIVGGYEGSRAIKFLDPPELDSAIIGIVNPSDDAEDIRVVYDYYGLLNAYFKIYKNDPLYKGYSCEELFEMANDQVSNDTTRAISYRNSKGELAPCILRKVD